MSCYFVKGKGWRYNFILKGTRYSKAWFKTRAEARKAEAKRKEEILNPQPIQAIPTDMGFRELVNRRLDFVQAYNSLSHYKDHVYMADRWLKQWEKKACSEITSDDVQAFMIKRKKVSAYTANKELRYLRAIFNFGIKRKWINQNPTHGIPFFPVDKHIRYVPPKHDVLKVFMAADPEDKEYLTAILHTMGRIGEINRLKWSDVDFQQRKICLFTRKKRGGNLTPRKIPLSKELYGVLSKRYRSREKDKDWVFWHRYWSRKQGTWIEGPYAYRKRLLENLCKRAGVRFFSFHALRHFGASLLDNINVGIGSIQNILGHEHRTTTEIYLHSLGEAERRAIELFECELEKSHTESHTEKEKGSVQIANPL